MNSYHNELRTAIRAALAAGAYFSEAVSNVKQIKTKTSQADLVTEYDPQCEEMIRDIIKETFPGHVVLGEEAVAPGSVAAHEAAESMFQEEHLWIVDPIDGTTNFVYELPLSVVSIAYAEAGEVAIGVVFDPYRDEVFAGARGESAVRMMRDEAEKWLQNTVSEDRETSLPGVKLHVLDKESVHGAMLATGFPPRASSRLAATEAALNLAREVKSLRALGSAALQLAYVAAGRLDAFWEYDLNAWDLAAACFLVQLAGGAVADLNGNAYSLLVRDIVAAGTPELLDDIIQKVAVPGTETSTRGEDNK